MRTKRGETMQNDAVFQTTENPLVELLEFPEGFNMEIQHYHDLYEIYLLVESDRYIFLNDEVYCLQKGDMFIVEPYVLHATRNLKPEYLKRYLINISPEVLLSILSKDEVEKLFKNFSTCIIRLGEEQSAHVYDLFNKAAAYSNRTDKRGTKLLHASIFCLLDYVDELLRTKKEEKILPQNTVVQRNELLEVISYVNDYYTESITLDFIAEYAHMSKSNFCRFFRKMTGETFGQYLNKYRITKAHQMLVETNLPLSEIANQTGFTSTAHMTRIFRQIHGKSPSGFRKRIKNI